ncbi:MAG: peptidylprolyl isomerase [Solirubrobacterales bacterium]
MKNITSNKFFIPGFALVVFLVVAIILAVTGGGVPNDAVASVKGDPIPKTQFNKTLAIFASQSAGQSGGAPVLPDPPSYKNCIAAKRGEKTNAKLGETALKKLCVTEWNTARDQIMGTLITQKWYELEAKERGITVTDAQVKARFEPLKQQSFPKEADYQKFLKTTGQTTPDILKLVKASMLQEQVRQAAATAPTPGTSAIESEYKKNKDRYSQPAARDLNVVFNSNKAKAEAAKAALDSGQSWSAVAKQYSQDSASKSSGGKFPGVTKGQFEPALDKAVFSAKKGAVVGPIKTQYGYYVFSVTKATPAKQQSLSQASATIKQTLQQQNQQKAAQDFQKEFTAKWRKKTRCADLYKMELCKNGPEPKKGATAATGAQ